MRELYHKYKEPILYILFGVLTTLVNIVVYYLVADVLQVYYLAANMLAWVASVLFAFATNKTWVFESKSWKGSVVLPEMGSFVLARVATGVLDMALMWVLVDLCLWSQAGFGIGEGGYMIGALAGMKVVVCSGEMMAKVLVNIVVIVLNYVASKLWIFRKKR